MGLSPLRQLTRFVGLLCEVLTRFFYFHRHNVAAAWRGPSTVHFDTTVDMRSMPSHVYAYQPYTEVAQEESVRKDWFRRISYSFVLGEASGFLQKMRFRSLPSAHR